MKNKKKLLNEELKRFNMLNEYSFYVPEGDDPEGDAENLLLGVDEAEDEDGADLEGLGDELGVEPEGGEDPADDFSDMDADVEADVDVDADIDADLDLGSDVDDESLPVEAPEDEVELDVTELVNSTDEAKMAADEANSKVDQLMGMVSKLETQLGDISTIGAKIDNLENELEKRAPTPEEKIEMRSFDSYPYNLKLTDFWKTQEGKYDVLGDESEGQPEEYTLTQDDVDSEYSESDVRSSMDKSNPYEEEDI